jgi:hypothetical protein
MSLSVLAANMAAPKTVLQRDVGEGVWTHEIMGQRSRVPNPIECVGAGIWAGKAVGTVN